MDCGCKWERHPDHGDVVEEQCAKHAAEAAAAARNRLDQVAMDNRARLMLDIELEQRLGIRR